MLPWLALTALAQLGTCSPEGPIFCKSSQFAFFEFAPSDGAGMGVACAGTTPTGAKGEAQTFTRASSATCLKTVGASPQLVQPGDMVTLSSGQPRVMPGADGTGVLGQLVEGARTNVALRGREFDNAAVWVPSNSVCGAITVTANAASGPLDTGGAKTAERVQIPACAGGFSLIQQTGLGGAGTYSEYVYAMGNGQSGSFIIDLGNVSCLVCSYTTAGWTQCKQEGRVLGAATAFSIGEDIADCGGGATAAQDFFLTMGQMELGSFASSYIDTTSAAVMRVQEINNAVATFTSMTTIGSVAATFVPPTAFTASTVGTVFGPILWFGTAGRPLYGQSGTGAVLYDGTNNPVVSVGTISTAGKRFASDWAGATAHVYNVTDSLSTSSAFSGTMTNAGKLGIGSDYGNDGPYFAWGVIKKVCADPSPTRCR